MRLAFSGSVSAETGFPHFLDRFKVLEGRLEALSDRIAAMTTRPHYRNEQPECGR